MSAWLTIIGQTLLVAACSFVLIGLIASHLRYQFLARKSREVKELGPVAQSAFELLIAQRLGTAHRNPAPFMVIRFTASGWPLLRDLHGAEAMNEAMERLRERLAKALRASDSVLRLQEDELGALVSAGRGASASLANRLLRELSATPVVLTRGTEIRVDMLAGFAYFPEDGNRASELYEKAERALDAARAAGTGWRSVFDAAEPAAAAQHPAHTGGEADTGGLLDPLTGVLAPDRMGSSLQKFVAARRRDDVPVSLLILDIDMLRRYNHQYGRVMGDALLKELGAFLQRSTRESDLIARWHEDQFVVAMDCAPAEAFRVANRLWNGIRREAFGGAGLRLSVTIGVAGWPDHSGTARGLFEEAQLALRVGKSKGRNQCVLFDREMRKLNIPVAPTEVF